jgi:hypothetical protein
MTHIAFTSEYCIYRLNKAANAYVIVAQNAAKIIRQYVAEYQGLATVPANIKVKGILTNDPYGEHKNTINGQFADVEINQLQFD